MRHALKAVVELVLVVDLVMQLAACDTEASVRSLQFLLALQLAAQLVQKNVEALDRGVVRTAAGDVTEQWHARRHLHHLWVAIASMVVWWSSLGSSCLHSWQKKLVKRSRIDHEPVRTYASGFRVVCTYC